MRRFDLAIVNAFRSFSSSSFRYSDGGWSREFTLATPNIIVMFSDEHFNSAHITHVHNI